MIPDLRERYGIDLRDLFSEVSPLSPGWVLCHIDHLTVESATVAEIRGGEQFRGWGADRYMTATLINAVEALRYITVLANSDPKKRKVEPPEPFPIPDGTSKRVRDSKPGSFAFIANSLMAKRRKQLEGGDSG